MPLCMNFNTINVQTTNDVQDEVSLFFSKRVLGPLITHLNPGL